jgi:RimJ/RimL family protein N-acetyltransferase
MPNSFGQKNKNKLKVDRNLFFNPDLKSDLDWKGQFKIRIGPVLPTNKEQISRSIRDLSAETIRNRFMGIKKEFSPEELENLSNLDGWDHFAIGIEEREKPHRGIAIVRMVRSTEDPVEAEIAITIIDEYQGLGLGTLLMRLIVLAASERKIERLSFTFLPQNEGILKLIKKIGPTHKGSTTKDYVQLYMYLKDLDFEQIKSQLVPLLPSIETFHSET